MRTMPTRSMPVVVLAVIVLAGVLLATPATAQNTPAAASSTVPAREQPAGTVLSEEQQARDWGLLSQDWTRYRELMRGPLGRLSPDLDPLTALGIEARSDAERARYAELQVRFEAQRTDRMLAYQRAYDAAWQRLFPGQARVSLPGVPTGPGVLAGASAAGSGRLAVFVKAGCLACEQRVRQLQAAGTAFDLYMVGSRQDDARIRDWAKNAGIEPAKVRARTITLNHDAGRWLSLGIGGDLPAIVQEVAGQWQRQS